VNDILVGSPSSGVDVVLADPDASCCNYLSVNPVAPSPPPPPPTNVIPPSIGSVIGQIDSQTTYSVWPGLTSIPNTCNLLGTPTPSAQVPIGTNNVPSGECFASGVFLFGNFTSTYVQTTSCPSVSGCSTTGTPTNQLSYGPSVISSLNSAPVFQPGSASSTGTVSAQIRVQVCNCAAPPPTCGGPGFTCQQLLVLDEIEAGVLGNASAILGAIGGVSAQVSAVNASIVTDVVNVNSTQNTNAAAIRASVNSLPASVNAIGTSLASDTKSILNSVSSVSSSLKKLKKNTKTSATNSKKILAKV